MEFKDKGAEVETMGGGSLLKNRFVQIIIALLALGFLGFLVLALIFLLRVLPGARGSTLAAAQRTATAASISVASVTPASSSQATATAAGILQATATTAGSSLATAAATSAPAAPSSPVPTATPVLTAAAPTQAAIPTTTRVTSPTVGPQVTPATNLPPGIYITRLRADPTKPRKGDPINFFATVLNTTGGPQVHRLCAEIYRAGEDKSFGVTTCPPQTIPPGTNELNLGKTQVVGIHDCLNMRARAITSDEGEPRIALLQPGGGVLWFNLQVCP